MPKKKAKKKVKEKNSLVNISISKDDKKEKPENNQILIENFVALQNVLTNLSISLNNLSKQTERLLNLFESSAKNIAEKGIRTDADLANLNKKLNEISDQNKIIAKGLTLVHERMPSYEESSEEINSQPQSGINTQGYQRSIAG